MEKKKTLKENYVEIRAFISENAEMSVKTSEWLQFLTDRITLLDNKKVKNLNTSKENDELKEKIYNYLLEKKEGATITELMKIFELSNQKLSAMANQMTKEEKPRLQREVGKNKKITFKAIAPSEENENVEV